MEKRSKVPAHVSIIMDGNGRWARLRGKERVHGHLEGVESVRACVEAAVRSGVRYLSLFAFSEENWGRPDEEVGALMALMMKAIENELGTLLSNGVSLRVLGNLGRLSPELAASIRDAEERTALPGGAPPVMTLVIFLSYSGKWDILQAAGKLAAECAEDPERLESIDYRSLEKHLVTRDLPDPDLVIRTSGEKRISNFQLWQAAYSEFLIVDTLWPDFRKEEFEAALDEYARRERRYGKVK